MDRDDLKTKARMGGAVLLVLSVIGGMAITAGMLNGLVAGVAFVVAAIVGIAGPPLAILSLREGIPNIAATGLAVAAQIAFQRAALVRRDDGRYEWTALRDRDDDGGFVA